MTPVKKYMVTNSDLDASHMLEGRRSVRYYLLSILVLNVIKPAKAREVPRTERSETL
jgi:hypothetical protein